MTIDLTNLLRHAKSVGADQADNKQIFLNDQGDISGRSGLGFFKRHFSSSARMQENRATLQAFQESIAASPKYGELLETQDVSRFFQTKHEQGTPLTARDVQKVAEMLHFGEANKVASTLREGTLPPDMNPVDFAMFCVGKGLHLDSPEDVKKALTEFYAPSFDSKAQTALTEAGVKPENLGAALKLLQASSSWSSAKESAFEGGLETLTHDVIMNRFSAGLEIATSILGDMVSRYPQANSEISAMTSPKNPTGITLFNGAVEAVKSGAIALEEGSTFVMACRMERTSLGSPAQLNAAINKFCMNVDSERIFIQLATDKGLPAEIGKALAHNPEFLARVGGAIAESVAPPAIPTRQQIDTAILETATVFLTEKNDAINALLALAGQSGTFDPALADLAGDIDNKLILQMLNPLLEGQALLDHLLDPEKGSDLDLIKLLQNFHAAMTSCQHTVEGDFGGPEMSDMTIRALAILMGARGADDDTMAALLEHSAKTFKTLGSSLDALYGGLMFSTIKASSQLSAVTAVNSVQNSMRLLANFAYSTTSDLQKTALGITTTPEEFYTSLEEGPDGKRLPMDAIHQSVRAFGKSVGVQINQIPYAESDALAVSEAAAFTGAAGNLAATDLLRERAEAIAREIGLTEFNLADIDLNSLSADIERAIRHNHNELLSPAAARHLSEMVLREFLQELKPVEEYIASLPTARNPEVPQLFFLTPAEKASLLRVIPGSPLRDPALIKATLQEARSLMPHVKKLLVPGLSDADMVRPLLQLHSVHRELTGSLQLQGGARDQVHGAQKAALALALDMLQPAPQQTEDLYRVISEGKGVAVGRDFAGMASLYGVLQIPDAESKRNELLDTVAGMDILRQVLGERAGAAVSAVSPYDGEAMPVEDIPGAVFEAVGNALRVKSTDMPGFAALAMVTPKLTPVEWMTLRPVIRDIGQSITDPFTHALALKMFAANAPELLAAIQSNQGRALSPQQIWETVIGGKAPRGTTMDNVGIRMHSTAVNRILQRAQAINPDLSLHALQPLIPYHLAGGIPFQTLYNAYQPGGRIGLGDMRLDLPTLSSLSDYTAANAYGLTTDWSRRQADRSGTPSQMTINASDGGGSITFHERIPDEENVATNPIFTKIMERCRNICRSDLQFQRVMQSLSQAGTINIRALAEKFVGMTLSEHSHMDSTVTPQPNGDVIVEFTNGPNDHPFGAHMQVTVTADGEATITDIGVHLRG